MTGITTDPIGYAVIANPQAHIVADYCCFGHEAEFNLLEVCKRALSEIPSAPGHRNYVYQHRVFSYLATTEAIFMCISPQDVSIEIPWQFLKSIERQYRGFVNESHELIKSGTRSRHAELTKLLKTSMDYYNQLKPLEAVNHVERQLDEVTENMRENINKVINRSEQINCLVNKTNSLKNEAQFHRNKTKSLGNKIRIRMLRSNIILVLIIFLAVLFIIVPIWIWYG